MSRTDASKINFDKPAETDALDLAFGGSMDRLLPAWNDIPEQYRRHRGTPMNEIVSRWFFMGLPGETQFIERDGIDGKAALRHVGSIMRSFTPKHEHKEAACAYLLDKWFSAVRIPETTPTRE